MTIRPETPPYVFIPSTQSLVLELEDRVFVTLCDQSIDGYCLYTRNIAHTLGIDQGFVKVCLRSLVDRGLATYHPWVMNDEGAPAGSGYSASERGKLLMKQRREAGK